MRGTVCLFTCMTVVGRAFQLSHLLCTFCVPDRSEGLYEMYLSSRAKGGGSGSSEGDISVLEERYVCMM